MNTLSASRRSSLGQGAIIRNIVTLVILASLLSIVYWRHSTGWSLGSAAHRKDRPTKTDSPLLFVAESNSPDRYALQFDSLDAVQRLGIDVAPVWHSEITEAITGSAQTVFDPNRVAHLTARGPGVAWRVLKRLGDDVKKGDVLALFESPDAGKAKTELQQALVHLRARTQSFANASQAPIREQQRREAQAALRDAESRVVSAEQALLNIGLEVSSSVLSSLTIDDMARRLHRLGLTAEFTDLPDDQVPSTLWPLVSPVDGVLTQCDVIAGETVSASKTLFTVADSRQLALELHVAPQDAQLVRMGQSVRFRPDRMVRETVGQVNWVSSTADERTRTITLRANLDNHDGRLWAGLLGVGRVILRQEARAVVVPNQAIQRDGESQTVFVQDAHFHKAGVPKRFHVRSVRCGARDEINTEILSGLRINEVVVTKGSSLLLDELRRSLHTNHNEAASGGDHE